jgi:dUTP pyrophosphatase
MQLIHPPLVWCRTSPHDLPLPARASEGAAGFDLPLLTEDDKPLTLWVGDQAVAHTGWSVAIPPGHVGLVWPRSGLAVQAGIGVGAGVIDSDYRGEVRVVLQRVVSRGCDPAPIRIYRGERIAQLIILPAMMGGSMETDSLLPTSRGGDGFGSTGR